MAQINASRLDGKLALVTGGASGIGRATCVALAAAGARVLVVDVSEAGGQQTARQVDGEFFRADVSQLEDNHRMVEAALTSCGGLDLVHLNAGVVGGSGLDGSFDPGHYRRVMGVNLGGVVFGTHAALPALATQRGAIVATSSVAGLTAAPFDPLYSASKHAVVGFARSMGPVLAARGVRFNSVCPSFTESPMIAPARDEIIASGEAIIPAETVAGAVIELFCGDMTGECWLVTAGREPDAFAFRSVPGAESNRRLQRHEHGGG
jgi:NAD(P)-dependent dehydrogenase (short-subunit alcohol dehydrogenase family)